MEIDAASHGGVDDARDLRERAFFAPVNSRYKVYIVDEAHMVTTQGFNALLKVVEEPPEFLVFVFATTEPDKVLPTIRSRTHHYPFRLVPPTTLRGLLEKTCAAEGVTVEPTVFPLVVRAGGGSVRDSLSILDQLLAGAGPEGVTYKSAVGLLGVTDDALLDETVDALAAHDAPAGVPRRRPRGRGRARPAAVRHRPARPAARPDRARRGARRRRQRPARHPARPARPDEPAGPGPGLGDAVADGRHRARRPHRDAGDDGAAAAARAGLRPHAAAGDRRLRGRAPAARAPRAADVDRRRRAARGGAAAPSARPERRVGRGAAAVRALRRRRPRPRRAGQPRPGAGPRGAPDRRVPTSRPSQRRGRGAAARPERPEPGRAAVGEARSGCSEAGRGARPEPPKVADGEPDIPLPPEPTDDEDWPHPASPAPPPRRRARHRRGRRAAAAPRRRRVPRCRAAGSRPRSSRPTPSRPPTATDHQRRPPGVAELLAVVKRHKRTTEASLPNARRCTAGYGVRCTLAPPRPPLGAT